MTEFRVTIQDVAYGGAGVGRLPLEGGGEVEPPAQDLPAKTDLSRVEARGKVVFVPDTLTGEEVLIRVTKPRKGFAEAALLKVIVPSPHRVIPECPWFGRCGGCQYQHAAYEEQLRIKAKQVRDALQRIGGFTEIPALHVEPAPQPYGYRNKITLHRGDDGALGFFARDHRTVLDLDRCPIASDTLNTQLAALRKSPSRPRHVSLVDAALRPESVEGGFHQVNTAMALKLLQWVRQQIGLPSQGQLFDLYCGAGFFTFGLADLFAAVCGMDRDERAIHAATTQARARGVTQAGFFAGIVEERLEWLLQNAPWDETVLLVDPPREGLAAPVSEAFARKRPSRFIYVSCDPATLARDLKKLVGAESPGYRVAALGMFDMFPQTAHIETVAVLEPS